MKTGRPPKLPSERYSTPARQIGRVKESVWAVILEAIKTTGKTKTEWAVQVLLREARKVLRQTSEAACPTETKEGEQS